MSHRPSRVLQPEDDYYFSGKELIPHFPWKPLTENPSSCPNFQSGQEFNIPLPLSFFELLEKLPREIKDKIYFCVLYSKVSKHACESEICHFKTQKHRKQYEWIQFETRYSSKPQADGKPLRILNQDDGMDYEEGLYPKDDAAVDLGLLRNIGAGKYSLSVSSPCFLENIISCLLSLMDVEGYFLDEDDKWRNVDEERKLGLSKDLLRWFWSHVVLDLGCAWGTSRDGMRWGEQETQYGNYLTACADRYHRIEKLHLEVYSGIFDGKKNDRHFTITCEIIKAALPNIQSLTLWLYLPGAQIDQITENPSVLCWRQAFREIVVWKTFGLQLRIGLGAHQELCCYSVVPDYHIRDSDSDDMDGEAGLLTYDILQKIQDIHQDTLRRFLMPRSLTDDATDDFPSELNLEGLFAEEVEEHNTELEQKAGRGRWYYRRAPHVV